jgi:hypothetical protein
MGGQRHATAALLPGKRPRTNYVSDWVGPRVTLDGCEKSRPPSELDSRAVQPVASRYTDWAIPARSQYTVEHKTQSNSINICCHMFRPIAMIGKL